MRSRYAHNAESACTLALVPTIKEYLAAIGKRGGQATAQKLTVKERAESARRAAQARWAKPATESAARRKKVKPQRKKKREV